MKLALLGALFLGAAAASGAAPSAEDSLKALRYGTVDAQERALDEVLAGRVPDAGPALLDMLPDSTGIDKIKVVRALGVVRETKAVRPLLGLLGDPSQELRLAVLRSLGHIGEPAAAVAVAKLLQDQDSETRETAALALGGCGTRDSVAALGGALQDPNAMVRLAAVDALGSLGYAQAFPLLKPLLKDADAGLKRRVVTAIGSLRSEDVGAILGTWLKDNDPYLRGFSAEALARRNRNPALEEDLVDCLQDPETAVRIRAAETLGVWKSQAAVQPLVRTLHSSDPTLRWKAVLALGNIGDASATEPLEYLRDHDSEEEIRTAAAEALKGLR